MQIWQKDGFLPSTRKSQRAAFIKILAEYRAHGAQGILSLNQLAAVMEKVDDTGLLEMYEIDDETTLQILVDCFGAKWAFQKITAAAGWSMTEIYKKINTHKRRVQEHEPK